MTKPYILGLDLGTSSIGWAIIDIKQPTEQSLNKLLPEALRCSGVRIFAEGMDRSKGEKSLNQDRSDARSLRRQGFRRVRRKQKLLHALQDAGLLPTQADQLDILMAKEDPYALRTRALDEKLAPYQIGRALYHLGQRRGYLSNRKTGKSKDDGKVATAINDIKTTMQQHGYRTIGEYFFHLDPHQQRRRGQYTAREDYLNEFNIIWETQAKYYKKQMDVANQQRIHHAIFYQRPLKIQKHLVGLCEFEPGRKRAPKASLAAQEFRLWQSLNNLKVLFSSGEERFLTDKERATLHKKLCDKKQLDWNKIRKELDFNENAQFNLEKVRKSGLLGNQTAAIIISAIGKKDWKSLNHTQQEQLTYDLMNIDSDAVLLKRLTRTYSFSAEQIDKLILKSLELPKGYLHLSSKAARNITHVLQRMATPNNQGPSYDQACAEASYDHKKTPEDGDKSLLPFPGVLAKNKRKKVIQHAQNELNNTITTEGLRNPLVERALYQVRRVVNALIKEHGLPTVIRVEMLRDLKNTRKQREEIAFRQLQNTKANERAEKTLKENGILNPSRSDKLKYRLWEECKHVCPYTGETIPFNALFGEHPQFDIEHIIPYSRCLDDSYMNKTLCLRKENEQKGNQTPWEFYHSNEAHYKEVLQRAKKLPYAKFKRFSKEAIKDLDDFVSQQLNESRYIARKTVAYLQQLKGVRIEPVKGGTTALLRRAWGLNNILSDSGEKTRLDHRHHAIDAIVCALTDRAAVQKLNRYAALSQGRLRIESYPAPISGLRQQAEQSVNNIIVSHKVFRKISGALHDETLYGKATDETGKDMAIVRMNIADLNEKDILGTGRKKIRDLTIRDLAKQHLEKYNTIKNAFGNPENPFTLPNKHGTPIPVNKVRVLTERSIQPIGKPLSPKNNKRRHVWTRNNHHVEIYETTNKKGKLIWQANVVSTLEAAQRKQQNQPIIQTHLGENKKFIMALHQNDMVRLTHDGETNFYRVEKMDQNHNLSFRLHIDADKKDWRRAIKKKPESFRQCTPAKITIDTIGNIIQGNE